MTGSNPPKKKPLWGTETEDRFQADTLWLADSGANDGMVYCATDELGFRAVEKLVHGHPARHENLLN